LILLGELEPAYARHVITSLERAGYDVKHAACGNDLVAVEEQHTPAVVVLDQALPGSLETVDRIREESQVPIVLLSSAGATSDLAASDGLRRGADGVITKPFAVELLVAQVGSLIRRVRVHEQGITETTFRIRDLYLDLVRRTVAVGSEPVHLSAREYALLRVLAINAGRILTHDQLLRLVWGPAYEGDCELLRAFIRSLRRKLHDNARQPRYIQTEFQVGYWMHRPELATDAPSATSRADASGSQPRRR
jgi:two-component system KDP operon response regulator KdpE